VGTTVGLFLAALRGPQVGERDPKKGRLEEKLEREGPRDGQRDADRR